MLDSIVPSILTKCRSARLALAALPVTVYLLLSFWTPPEIGLASGEFNLPIVNRDYPLSVYEVRVESGALINVFNVPVPGERTIARTHTRGPLTTVRAYVEPEYAVRLGDTLVPVMKNDYTGALSYLWAWPFAQAEQRAWALHLASILLGALAVALLHGPGHVYLGAGPGLFAALLLATNPVLIFWRRLPALPEHLTDVFGLALVLLLFLLVRSGRPRHFFLGALVAGLGLYQKVTLVWVLGPLLLIMALYRWRPGLSARQWGAGILLGLLGLSPLILFNLDFAETMAATGKLFSAEGFWQSLPARFGARAFQCYMVFLEPVGFMHLLLMGAREAFFSVPLALLLGLALVLPLANAARREPWVDRRRLGFAPLMLLLLFVVTSVVSKGGFDFGHTLMFIPYLALAQGAALHALGALLPDGGPRLLGLSPARLLPPVLLVGLLALQVAQLNTVYTWERGADGAIMSLVDTHREAARDLQRRGIRHPVTTTYNLMGVLEFISTEQLRPLHYWTFWTERGDDPTTLTRILRKNRGGHYLYKAGFEKDPLNFKPEPTPARLQEAAHRAGVKLTRVAGYRTAGGREMYTLFAIQ